MKMKMYLCKRSMKTARTDAGGSLLFRPANSLVRPSRPPLAAMIHAIAISGAVSLAPLAAVQAAVNVPTDLPPSPLFGATAFSQQMLLFEEFGTQPLPDPNTSAASLPGPVGADPCNGTPDSNALDNFLEHPLSPAPSWAANTSQPNPWANQISNCIGRTMTGVIEGRPQGEWFSHQRWNEFFPQQYFQSAQTGARINGGIRDNLQLHGYNSGEFGPVVSGQENRTGLYHNTVGPDAQGNLDSAFDGSTRNIGIRIHPNMPIQEPQSVWTFDGTLPPKLLMARYGIPTLFRHYNALPIDIAANNGFGEHTISTHEHNGHNPAESDGFFGAYFYPGQFYDYRWPMQLAGYDSINTDASKPRAATPCSPGETLMIPDNSGVPTAKTCDPATGTVKIRGDWHETMSTHWFHDHMADRTAQNVYKGNAAMMNYYSAIDRGKEGFQCNYANPNNANLCFPSGTTLDWGNRDYDINLAIADKAWDANGQLHFNTLNTDGFLGDAMTVNWLYKPYLDVRARRYRLRMLDASVSRFFKIAIVREYNDAGSGEMPGPAGSNKSYSRVHFHMVANDGNIMEHAVPFPNPQSKDLPVMSIAERHDVIIDFSQFPAGTKLYMVNTLAFSNGKGPEKVIPLADILNGSFAPQLQANSWKDDPTVTKFLELRVQPYSGTDLSMNPADYEVGKKMMVPLVKFTDAELQNAKHRTFEFGTSNATDGKPWSIRTDGGKKLTADPSVVSAAPELNDLEIWHFINSGASWAHPVHVHFEEGQLLLRGNADGSKHHPPLWEIGARKDVYRVSGLGEPNIPGLTPLPDESMTIDVAIRFREFLGTYVEHCHNTQHEDTAMLLRYDVEHPGQVIRIPTPLPNWDGVSYGPTDQLGTIKTGDLNAEASFQPPAQLTADLNNDTVVNNLDSGILKSSFLYPGLWSANINEDQGVNNLDTGILKLQWLNTTGFPLPPNNTLP
ncbi:multicopper oxidase domain-containing protein [Methylomonas sp. LL1]|nr:multicopper oxidase domain-containing protein [Methylomonas sp. LL1]